MSEKTDTQPDQELVEAVAGWMVEDHGIITYCERAKFILCHISNWQGKDGSRVVRTDPDQTLPHLECNDFSTRKAQTDMVKAGWVKILPLIGKDGE